MTIAERPRPLIVRVLDWLRVPPSAPTALPRGEGSRERVVALNADGTGLESYGVDLLGQQRSSALSRRLQRSNSEIAAGYAAVFAAVRWREQAITRPQIVLQQRSGGEWESVGTLDDPVTHPALEAIRRVNETTTTKQGLGGIERGKLTNGEHYWVKRRDGLGTVVEFEVWDGASVKAVPREDRPWVPDHFKRRLPDGREQTVGPEDMIWFRHIVHPRNPMLSLTPIGAIRVQADNAAEALRYEQRLFDQGIGSGGLLVPGEEGIGPSELERLRAEIERDWVGTDNAHRWHLLEANLKMLATPQTNADLQFMEQLKWGVIEVARAFEVSPITLKDFDKATYTNADQAAAQDWETIRNQLDATVAEFNEFLIRPDFGDDWRLQARYAGIAALQDAFKMAAEVDDIRMRSGYATINELRERDGLESVPWGDAPLVQVNMAPLGSGAPPPPAPSPEDEVDAEQETAVGGRALREVLAVVDEAEQRDWSRRELKNALRASPAFGGRDPVGLELLTYVERRLEAEHREVVPPAATRKTVERDPAGRIVAVREESA